MKVYIHKNTTRNVNGSFISNNQKLETNTNVYQQDYEFLKKTYLYKVILISVKGKELLIQQCEWISKSLLKVSQTEKNTYCLIPFMWLQEHTNSLMMTEIKTKFPIWEGRVTEGGH